MNFADFSPLTNGAIFVLSAIAVWVAGTQLAKYADEIAERTHLGQEVLGMLLLGGVTSLPELAVATTATLQGTPTLSVNDVLGSAAINIVILALADAISGRTALTSVQGSPALMLQGVLCMILMALAAAAVVVGDRTVLGMGGWTWAMLATYFVAIRLITSSNANRAWLPASQRDQRQVERMEKRPAKALIARTVGAALVILCAGFLLARSGGGLADQTGLGTSFFGAVFLALSTSLPELSTVIAATRRGRYEMAISDVFGTNLFNVTIIVFVDALHAGEPVMVQGGRFAAFGALLALVLTAFYLVGMLERRNKVVLRMGWDSLAVLVAYGVGVVVLHGLR